jgi:hypothetical protein
VTFEPCQGGRVYETWQDGTEVEWGRVLAWAPPEQFVMTWNMTSVAIKVELTFTELGPRFTLVTVEHRGWVRLTREELGKDCALPGGYLGGAYREGWTHPRLPGRDDGRASMKAVVFYESADDLAEKAPLHAGPHRARWREFADRGELLMIGPFANALENGAMGIFTTREAAE